MDIKPQTTQSTSDDQELAKVLAGVSDDTGAPDGAQVTGMTPPPMPEPTAPPPAAEPDVQAVATEAPVATAPEIPAMPEVPDSFAAPSPADSSLDTVKKDAINELRPLVDKLNISAEEKFDTYLLLIRSTDDKTLVAPAHEAAKEIADEARRAQALLDIIKEIDFLTNPQQQQ